MLNVIIYSVSFPPTTYASNKIYIAVLIVKLFTNGLAWEIIVFDGLFPKMKNTATKFNIGNFARINCLLYTMHKNDLAL